MVLEAVWVADVASRKLIVFNPNGGVFTENGQTTADVKSYYYSEGTRIGIPQAPVRSGYTFLYWQGSTYYPGDSYLVLENHTFTAQWAKNASPDDDSDDSGDSGGSSSSPSTPAPVTPTVINPFAYYFSDVPGVPDTGNSNSSKKSSKSGSGFGGPDTGDNSHMWLWAFLFAASVATFLIAACWGRRRKSE